MSNVRIARPQEQKQRPAFVVKELEGKRTVSKCRIDKEGKIIREDKEIEGGYMVSFPIKGNSIIVDTKKQLEALGFDQTIPILKTDGDDEDVVAEMPNPLNTRG